MITVSTKVKDVQFLRALNGSTNALQQACERMSSGYKINQAADDAAGLVISKGLTAQTSGLTVANKNAQMATNLLSVADSVLSKVADTTLRIRDLALQAANAGYSEVERKVMQDEVDQLTEGMRQSIVGAKFNEYKIFGSQEPTTIKVSNAKELYEALNSAEATNNENFSITLTRDIDLSELEPLDVMGSNWKGIGSAAKKFKGTIDGAGYSIKNMKIASGLNYQAFIGYADGAIIKNLNLENAQVERGGSYKASLIAHAEDVTVSNCSASGKVSGEVNVGGLVAFSSGGDFVNCYSDCDITATGGASSSRIGGFVGAGDGKFQNCYSVGQILTDGVTNFVGGFSGGSGTLNNCNYIEQDLATYNIGVGTKQNTEWFREVINWEPITGETSTYDLTTVETQGVPKLNKISTSTIEIHCAQQLFEVLNSPKALNNTNINIVLTADINLDDIQDADGLGSNWLSVGDSVNKFMGTFDGAGFTISNLKINKQGVDYQGLFGSTHNATLKNIKIENATVSGASNTAILVGSAENTDIEGCVIEGTADGESSVGALAGNIESSTVSDCSASGSVQGLQTVGGVFGNASSNKIESCYGDVDVTRKSGTGAYFGGFVGNNASAISNCYSTGQLLTSGITGNVGGFSGCMDGTVIRCNYLKQEIGNYNMGQATSRNEDWFKNTDNLKDTLGNSDKWSYSTNGTVLKDVDERTRFQIGIYGDKLNKIFADLSFKYEDMRLMLNTQDDALAAVDRCDALLKRINQKRGGIGASMNIVEAVVQNNSITHQNLSASKSTIQDADIAKESANMIKSQILQNSASSLMVKSKDLTQGLLLQLYGVR